MKPVDVELKKILLDYLSSSTAEAVVRACKSKAGHSALGPEDLTRCAERVSKSLRLYGVDLWQVDECVQRIHMLARVTQKEIKSTLPPPGRAELHEITAEADIVTARNAGRELCRRIGFSHLFQIKVATVISELSRNIIQYAGSGTIALSWIEVNGRRGIEVVASDNGPGIASLNEIFRPDFRSRTGMGLGLSGSKRLMDEFEIKSEPQRGTEVRARKFVA